MRRLPAWSVAAVLVIAPAASGLAAGAEPVPIAITAAPGRTAQVAHSLGASALRVVRREGRDMQVAASIDRLAGLRAIPGVAAAFVASTAVPEAIGGRSAAGSGPVRSQGFDRIGAGAMQRLARQGQGLVIAVLDMGFGEAAIPPLQAARELPPANRLELMSFDTTWGIAGRNAYGNATSHGALVAQTVYDYAPAARYLFVNYHTEQDFQAAVEWLIPRRPDVVVHSNSFLEGPFDGTSPAARAVDRAAAAGIAWVNSAGNYAQGHWEGAWVDADDDRVLDWSAQPDWVFTVAPGSPITFALSWDQAAGAPASDLDLVLEKRAPSGEWLEVAASRDSQMSGARAAERITGVSSADGGDFRLRAVLAAGVAPAGRITVFSREIPMDVLGDASASSVPTPGDARGSITVGAVDWSNDALKAYSSHGPTDDGRTKPDITAPTNTLVRTTMGVRSVGGTSNAAPNAAGAIALLLGARRRAGAPLDPVSLAGLIASQALDLGAPGTDDNFGAGRIRLDVDPPGIILTSRPPRLVRALPVRLSGRLDDESKLGAWTVEVDGSMVLRRRSTWEPSATLGRRWLPEGRHVIRLRAGDWPGNVATRALAVVVDTGPPRVTALRLERADGEPGLHTAPRASRAVHLTLEARDATRSTVRIVLRGRDGREISRIIRFQGRTRRAVDVGPLSAGRYTITITASDSAGHSRTITRGAMLRP